MLLSPLVYLRNARDLFPKRGSNMWAIDCRDAVASPARENTTPDIGTQFASNGKSLTDQARVCLICLSHPGALL